MLRLYNTGEAAAQGDAEMERAFTKSDFRFRSS